MKRVVYITIWSIAITVFLCPYPRAMNISPQCGTFNFKNFSVAEALKKIEQNTGVTIYAPFDQLNNQVDRVYDDAKFEYIISDMMRGRDHAIVWYSKNKKIVAVEIRLPSGEDSRNMPNAKSFHTTGVGGDVQDTIRKDIQKAKNIKHLASKQSNRHFYKMNEDSNIKEKSDGRPSEKKHNGERKAGFIQSGRDNDSTKRMNKKRTISNPKEKTAESVPPSPEPKKFHGLEPPPMPPGM